MPPPAPAPAAATTQAPNTSIAAIAAAQAPGAGRRQGARLDRDRSLGIGGTVSCANIPAPPTPRLPVTCPPRCYADHRAPAPDARCIHHYGPDPWLGSDVVRGETRGRQ